MAPICSGVEWLAGELERWRLETFSIRIACALLPKRLLPKPKRIITSAKASTPNVTQRYWRPNVAKRGICRPTGLLYCPASGVAAMFAYRLNCSDLLAT